jgi:hypothetical protein
MAKIVSRKMPNYSSDTIGLKTVRKTPVSDAAARLKNGACETMPLPGEAARCRAIGWPMLWTGWGTELQFWREGFDEFRGDAFDGEEVIDGADGGLGSGLYDAFGEFFADTGE